VSFSAKLTNKGACTSFATLNGFRRNTSKMFLGAISLRQSELPADRNLVTSLACGSISTAPSSAVPTAGT
jgi:hypothetical protein